MRFLLVVIVLLSACLLSGHADALSLSRDRQNQGQNQQERRPDERELRADRSAEAARRAQQRNGGGRVLSVDPEGNGYRVKVLKDGEVRTHHVEGD